MRKYHPATEQNIRLDRLTREWAHSGLIDSGQCAQILSGLPIAARRTNVFLRLILFAFTALIIVASVLLAGVLLNAHEDQEIAPICFAAAAFTFVFAESLIHKFHLYRCGVEEAAALSAAALCGTAVAFAARDQAALALTVAAAAAFLVYLRFGYIAAALGSMLCLSAIPFYLGISTNLARLLAAGTLASIWLIARRGHREHGDEFPGDEYGFIEAAAWLAAYGFINLQLTSLQWLPLFGRTLSLSFFYWFTYVMIWLLPATGLYLGIRDKHRLMLDVNLGLALVTLITNKPYLHAVRKPWDPILFGVLLIVAAAVMVRRWLKQDESGARKGFTASRLLSSELQKVSLVGTASVVLHAGTMSSQSSSPETYNPGGGRSGGAGAGGSF